MGTSCAPSFANVNLDMKESEVNEVRDLWFPSFGDGAKGNERSTRQDGLILYVRYIDDIFLVFKGTKAACQSCLDGLSFKLKPFTIGWEINLCREPKSFLDVEFFFDQGYGPVEVQTRVYRKRMNQHQYILWSSAHPDAVKKAFIKVEITRYMIISFIKNLFEERVSKFMLALGRRGYPLQRLRVWRKQVKYEDRLRSLSKRKDAGARGLSLMLLSSYDEVWEYIDLRSVFSVMRDE